MKITEKELKKIIAEEARKVKEAIRPNRSFEQLQPPAGLSWDDLDILQDIHKHLATVAGGGDRANQFAAVLQKMGVQLPASAPSADPAPDSALEEAFKASDIRNMVAEEIKNILKEGFGAFDAAAAPEVKEKLAAYGLDVGNYSDREIGNLLQSFIYSFGTRVNTVEDTIRMIDSRYSPEGEYKLNKPEDRPNPEKDMVNSKKPLKTKLDRYDRYDSWADDGDFEQSRYDRKQRKRDRYWDDIERQQRRRGY